MCVTSAVESFLTKQKETIQICHQKILSLDKSLILREKKMLKYHYQVIANESYQRNSRVSAAGYFPVDNTLILFIVTTIGNNLVAICQFFLK